MKLDISTPQPGITRVLIDCEALDAGNNKVFREQITPLLDQHQIILLDMHRLSYIDSAGLASLLFCLRVMSKRHATLRLFGMSQTVQALFELVRMDLVFEAYPTEHAALKNIPINNVE